MLVVRSISSFGAMFSTKLRSLQLADMPSMGGCVQSLALAHADIKDDVVFFSPWKEQDFRTGKDPWWT